MMENLLNMDDSGVPPFQEQKRYLPIFWTLLDNLLYKSTIGLFFSVGWRDMIIVVLATRLSPGK